MEGFNPKFIDDYINAWSIATLATNGIIGILTTLSILDHKKIINLPDWVPYPIGTKKMEKGGGSIENDHPKLNPRIPISLQVYDVDELMGHSDGGLYSAKRDLDKILY